MEEVRGELRDIVREARVMLTRARELGARGPVARSPAPAPAVQPAPVTESSRSARTLALPGFEEFASNRPAVPSFAPDPVAITFEPRADLPLTLPELASAVASCRQCGLCETRTQTVFADGSPTARLVFVGEAPGRDEDAQGLPFVGRAGQLLNKMIAAIDLKREEVYICNVLKCRPPENRVPAPEEVERCRPYLEQQISLVKPVLICALGLSAAQALLQTKATMSSMRGKTFFYRGVPVIPTYHPAALLRNPGLKREAWIDLQRVRDVLRERNESAVAS